MPYRSGYRLDAREGVSSKAGRSKWDGARSEERVGKRILEVGVDIKFMLSLSAIKTDGYVRYFREHNGT
jgi:hypothetical protein